MARCMSAAAYAEAMPASAALHAAWRAELAAAECRLRQAYARWYDLTSSTAPDCSVADRADADSAVFVARLDVEFARKLVVEARQREAAFA